METRKRKAANKTEYRSVIFEEQKKWWQEEKRC
jgi:hypothetical protein